ncbi:MAG TPA: alcohol dehydrogenase catalytic domain-containing protein [Candidatus Dormibacteraeota bacterium]|jgi:threonine dehydrogenase-like Zn-dependent dehydrogenase
MGEGIRAAVQVGPRQIELREFPRPRIGPDDGLLRIEHCGICGSDVEQYHGNLRQQPPFIPGHEPLGIVEEVGERAAARWGVQPGDRVALEIIVPCGACERCLAGGYLACPNRHGVYGYTPVDRAPGVWGGYADHVYLHPNAIVHPMRRDIPAEVAVMFNPLGAGVRWTCDLGRVGLGDTVLILGAGQRGLASVIVARAAGAGTIIVTGLSRDRAKLDLARELGADHTIDVEVEDTVERVTEITNGRLADVVLELTPLATQPLKDGIEAARHGGRLVIAGLKGRRPVEIFSDRIVNKALTIVGAYGVGSAAYREAIRIIESGRFPLERLHTHTFGLDETALAIETLAGEVEGEQAVHVSICPGAA